MDQEKAREMATFVIETIDRLDEENKRLRTALRAITKLTDGDVPDERSGALEVGYWQGMSRAGAIAVTALGSKQS